MVLMSVKKDCSGIARFLSSRDSRESGNPRARWISRRRSRRPSLRRRRVRFSAGSAAALGCALAVELTCCLRHVLVVDALRAPGGGSAVLAVIALRDAVLGPFQGRLLVLELRLLGSVPRLGGGNLFGRRRRELRLDDGGKSGKGQKHDCALHRDISAVATGANQMQTLRQRVERERRLSGAQAQSSKGSNRSSRIARITLPVGRATRLLC